jgi:proteic killer suppression protein
MFVTAVRTQGMHTMRLATSVRTSPGIACSVAVMSSQAATMTLTDWEFGSGNSVNVSAPIYNGAAGGFKGTLTGAGPGFDTNSLYTYCVQLTQSFNWGTPYAVNVTLASDYFANNPVFGAGSGVENTKAALLGKLFSYVEADPTRVDTSAESTAPRLAGMLRRLNETTNAQGMNLPGWGLHPLKGRDLKGHFSVWVNGNWRMTFTFEGTDAVLVDYLDYH